MKKKGEGDEPIDSVAGSSFRLGNDLMKKMSINETDLDDFELCDCAGASETPS